MEGQDNNPKGVVHSRRIKAGKRTYFIDVKQTRKDDYYITLTESKRQLKGDQSRFIRHKILLYKEDFNKVLEGLTDTISFIKSDLMPDYDFTTFDNVEEQDESASAFEIEFEDLDSEKA